MEQQQFRISFSVGTKLLISIASLLFILIVFLSSSTILILTNDKQAYTFETKSLEASLSGQELSNTIQHVFDTLRLSLSTVDPGKAPGSREEEALKSVLANQSDVAFVSISSLSVHDARWTTLLSAFSPKTVESNGLSADQLAALSRIPPDWTRIALPEITKTGFGFINLSTPGHSLLGVVLADRSYRAPNSPGVAATLPTAIGIVSLARFHKELAGLSLTVASRSGWVLFDTDASALYSRKNIKGDPIFEAALANSFKTGTQAYQVDGKRYLGAFTKPGYDLVVISRTSWYRAMRATYALTEKFILLGCMAIGAGITFAIFFSKTLTAPINILYQAAQEVGQGNFNLSIEPKTRDELGALTQSFNVMSRKIRELFAESIEKTILEKELDIASTVQQTLIPPVVYRDPDIEFHSHYQAASRCGGDWWGVFRVGDRLVVGIADATGHGFTSALITAAARGCFSVLHKLAVEDPDFSLSPSAMLSYANRVIFDSSQGNIMMTFFIATLDLSRGTLTYANAAHNPPWLFSRQEGGSYRQSSLVSSGSRLGEKLEIDPLTETSVPIAPGDILFLYTDGLVEGKGEGDEMYGKKRTRKIVEANLDAGPQAIVEKLMEDFLNFHQWKELDDDITLAVARLLDPAGGSRES